MQLKLPTIARDITNLSDARFFASYGVEWLCFSCNKTSTTYQSVEQIKEIMQWISGCKMIGNVQGCSPDQIQQIIDDLQPNALLLELKQIGSVAINMPLFYEFIITPTTTAEDVQRMELSYSSEEGIIFDFRKNNIPVDLSLLPEKLSMAETFVDGEISFKQIDQLIDNSKAGIVVYGGHEDEVGLKDFDDVQEIMEFLLEV